MGDPSGDLRPRWPDPVVLLALAGGVLGTGCLVLWGLSAAITFGPVDPERKAEANRLFTAAFYTGTVLPMVGLYAAPRSAFRFLRWIFVPVLLLTLAVGIMVWLNAHHPEQPYRPAHPPPACREHSGGDTTCPGG